MKRFIVLAVICTLLLASCIRGADYMGPESTPTNELSQDKINVNAAKVFGTSFSADQDWSSTKKYTVSVTADAPMADIAKVQILTEAPYFNEDARVLNEASAKNGQTVSITFDCPSEYTELVAACVDSKGVYYVAGFKAGDSSVSFTTRASTRAEYDLPAFPDVSGLKMKYKNSHLSYNAIRTIKANADDVADATKEENDFSMWKDANWDNERLWMLSNAGGNTTWKVGKQTIYRDVTMTEAEREGLETILAAVGGKNGRNKEYKLGNLNTIRNSPVYQLTKNYLIADGKSPITLTPVQMLTQDIINVSLYYYYFKPSDLEGKSEDEQITFLKNLPKFKCVDGKLTKQASGTMAKNGNNYTFDAVNNGNYFKVHEYVLPFFGDVTSNTTNDITVQSFTIPKGYYVGFMLRKNTVDYKDSYTKDNDIYTGSTNYTKRSYTKTANGEVYADGRLNEQINQYPDFQNAIDKGMKLDDPRAAIFGANQKAYLMFEEGADVNYADIIVEINGGLQEVDAAQQINNNVYTFCFEDRNLGDYDMNDVVIKAERLNMTQVKYTVAACGAYDELYLRKINGKTLNETTEIHALFGVNNLSTFINTQSMNYKPVSEVITVDPSFSFTDFSQQVYIYNKTQGYERKMAQKGEDPHGIMIPCDFAYPKEKTCIKDAYKKFNSWGENPVTSTDWYLEPEEGKIIE